MNANDWGDVMVHMNAVMRAQSHRDECARALAKIDKDVRELAPGIWARRALAFGDLALVVFILETVSSMPVGGQVLVLFIATMSACSFLRMLFTIEVSLSKMHNNRRQMAHLKKQADMALAAHLEQLAEIEMRAGMGPDAARRNNATARDEQR